MSGKKTLIARHKKALRGGRKARDSMHKFLTPLGGVDETNHTHNIKNKRDRYVYPDKDDKDGVGLNATTGRNHSNAWLKTLAVSARFDVTDSWTVKLEAHDNDGTAIMFTEDNPDPKEKWKLYALKASYSF